MDCVRRYVSTCFNDERRSRFNLGNNISLIHFSLIKFPVSVSSIIFSSQLNLSETYITGQCSFFLVLSFLFFILSCSFFLVLYSFLFFLSCSLFFLVLHLLVLTFFLFMSFLSSIESRGWSSTHSR